MSVSISVENVVKRYDKLTIIPNLSLNIKNDKRQLTHYYILSILYFAWTFGLR